MSITLNRPRPFPTLQRSALFGAVVLQIGCSVVFVLDAASEWNTRDAFAWVEAMAIVALLIGAGLAVHVLGSLMRRNRRVERELDVASGAFQRVIEEHVTTWGLTKAERDVALLSIKGMSITEIAGMRATREGTIKAQSAAIYRKAGVTSRADLISAVIEDLIGGLSLARSAD